MILQLNKNNFHDFVSNSEKLVIVNFNRKTCSHCEKLYHELVTLSDIEDQNVVFGAVDIEEEIEISDRYDIVSVPALLFFKNREMKEKLVGYYSALVIEANIIRLKQLF